MRRWIGTILVVALVALLAARGLGAEAPPVVRPGTTGAQILILQELLHAAGYPVPVSGTYDDATKQAAVAFQRTAGLIADGEVAEKTWAALAAKTSTVVGIGTVKYTVQPGDSLGGIAERFDSSSAALVSWNGLADANHIEVGRAITLIGPGSGPAVVASSGTASGTASVAAPAAAPPGDAGEPALPAMVLLPGSLTIEAATPATAGASHGPVAGGGSTVAPGITPAVQQAVTSSGPARAPVTYAPAGDKLLALTFCDLPTSQDLPDLLRMLKDSGLKATFFVGGEEAEHNPAVVKALVDAGQEIESHGYQHRIWAGQSASSQLADLLRAQNVLTQLTGRAPRYYRPPGGSYDENLQASVQRVKLQMVMWSSINARDQDDVAAAELAAAMGSAAFPGAVLMLHASRSATVDALPMVINALHRGGYASVPLAQLLAQR